MATRLYIFEVPLESGDYSGLEPAPSFHTFVNAATGAAITPQPTITDLGGNFFSFEYDDTTLIAYRVDMGTSAPDETVRYVAGVIGNGEQYVRNADVLTSSRSEFDPDANTVDGVTFTKAMRKILQFAYGTTEVEELGTWVYLDESGAPSFRVVLNNDRSRTVTDLEA